MPALSDAVDDTRVEYTSLLSMEERRRRFSEVLDDQSLAKTIRVEKMFRQMQRKVYCNMDNTTVGFHISFYFHVHTHMFSFSTNLITNVIEV